MIWISILIISGSMCVHSNWIIIKYVSNWPITLVEGICASKTYGWKIFSFVMLTVLRNWKNLSLSLLLLLLFIIIISENRTSSIWTVFKELEEFIIIIIIIIIIISENRASSIFNLRGEKWGIFVLFCFCFLFFVFCFLFFCFLFCFVLFFCFLFFFFKW